MTVLRAFSKSLFRGFRLSFDYLFWSIDKIHTDWRALVVFAPFGKRAFPPSFFRQPLVPESSERGERQKQTSWVLNSKF